MTVSIQAHISEQIINLAEIISTVQRDDHGAINLFVGTVRNHHDGKPVKGITYDVHEDLAKKCFEQICAEAEEIWPGTRYDVTHFKGDLPVGGISVVIAVSSPHRAESFQACRYAIEELKKRAPIWKQEHYPDGKSDWLPGHSLKEIARG